MWSSRSVGSDGTAPIRVLIADDQELVRGGFRTILDMESGIVVVGEASDGSTAVELALRLKPDVVCMDIQMPNLDGLEATRAIVTSGSLARVLILTTFDFDEYIFGALAAGASGFMLKSSSPEQLVNAVRLLDRGDALLSPSVTQRVIERFVQRPGGTPLQTLPPSAALTYRENDVMKYMVRGNSNAEIAEALQLGESTIKTHVSRILLKLGLRDRVHLVIHAYENGLIAPGD